MLGEAEGKSRVRHRMRRLDGITNSMGVNLSRLREIEKDRKARRTAAKSRIWLSNWPTNNNQTDRITSTDVKCSGLGRSGLWGRGSLRGVWGRRLWRLFPDEEPTAARRCDGHMGS